ncbi:MAG: hypothetical protein U0S36_10995 [Candidatus Nanopelagicales bacterium]|jgi:hypothetical protein
MSSRRRSRRLHYRRTFLNRPGHHAGAHVIAEIEETVSETDRYVDASLTIADCSRQVTLDFSLERSDPVAVRRNALHKARVLRDTVVAFTDRLEQEYADDAW